MNSCLRCLFFFTLKLSRLVLVSSFHVNLVDLCFPTATRLLDDFEVYSLEERTDDYLRLQGLQNPETFVSGQAWVPYHTVLNNAQNASLHWFVMNDTLALTSPFRVEACWTVTLQVNADLDYEVFDELWRDPKEYSTLLILLRVALPDDFFVPAQTHQKVSTTAADTTGNESITTKTTEVDPRKWTWLWILACTLTMGSLAIVAVWCIYFNSELPGYITVVDSKAERDDKSLSSNEQPDMVVTYEQSLCSSICTS